MIISNSKTNALVFVVELAVGDGEVDDVPVVVRGRDHGAQGCGHGKVRACRLHHRGELSATPV